MMKQDLKNKTALVTGGAIRVGRGICLALAAAGCNVVIHYHRSRLEARQLARELDLLGGQAWLVPGDLRCAPGCNQIFEKALCQAGRVDFLINNAAVFHKQPLATVSPSDLQTQLGVNLFAPLTLMQTFTRHARAGKIINILDSRVASQRVDAIAYSLSKKALADLTRMAAVALAPAFSVNGVAPGPVLLPSNDATVREKAGKKLLGKRSDCSEIAEAVLFLLRSKTITGQIIFVDGGRHLLG